MNICNEGGPVIAFRDAWGLAADRDIQSADPPDADYCRARERAERAAAKTAQSIEARRVHQELAQAYAQRAQWRGEDGRAQ